MTEQIRKAQAGDGQAFTLLMQEHTPYMYRIARGFFRDGMELEDAMAQTVLDCWAKLGTLRQPEYFRSWLTRILINNCRDMIRRRSKLVPLEYLPEEPAPERELSWSFQELMDCLSDRVRPVMQLYYGEEWTVQEIALALHIPQGTVSTRLRRGRQQTEQILRERGYME